MYVTFFRKTFFSSNAGDSLGVPIHVFGPETHMTAIVSMALGKRNIPTNPQPLPTTANFLLPGSTVFPPFFITYSLIINIVLGTFFKA